MFSPFSWKKKEIIFTVVVLLSVLVISQIQLRVGKMKARDAQRKADAELVSRALNRYHQVNEIYPPASDGQIVLCGDILDLVCVWGQDGLRDEEGVSYLGLLPIDPLSDTGRTYVYEVSPDLKNYRIYVSLEYRQDPAWKANLTTECSSGLQCNWYVGSF